MEQEKVQVPRRKTNVKAPAQTSPTTQVKTKYEVDMYGRKKVDRSEERNQNKYRQTYSSQPPPSQPPAGEGAGGHGGGGGGDGGDSGDLDDDGSDDDEDDEEDEEDETSSTQEIPPEDLPEELQRQRVFRKKINIRGRDFQQRQQRNPRRGGGGGNSPSPLPPPSGTGPPRRRRR